MSNATYKYNKGTIFSRTLTDYKGTKTVYWKITGEPYKGGWNGHYESYPVVKSTKTGKEFKTTNGLCVSYIDEEGQLNGEIKIIAENVPTIKVDNEKGIEIGKIKRRMGYLEMRMHSDSQELVKLTKKLGEIETNLSQ